MERQQQETFKQELKDFLLKECSDVKTEKGTEHLVNYLVDDLGIYSLPDLQEVDPQDLAEDESGLKKIQAKKLIRKIKDKFEYSPPSGVQDVDQLSVMSSDTDFTFGSELSFQTLSDTGAAASYLNPNAKMLVRYVLCKDLFSVQITEANITNLSPHSNDSFDTIRKLIRAREGIPGSMELEFYSHEGYPLNMNEYSQKFSLSKWKVENNALLYVFARKIHQPCLKAVVKETGLQPLPAFNGNDSHRVEVYSQLHGEFLIYVDSVNDTGLEVRRRVFGRTTIHPALFDLFTNEGTKLVNAVKLTDLKFKRLFMVTKAIYHFPDGIEELYGACTYAPIVEQTNEGMAKFFSIVYYLVKSGHVSSDLREKIVAFFDKEYDCPPLTYALKVLFQKKSLSQISLWVALVEGLYQLFSALLKIFWIVPDNKVFEFSDYMWGMILQQSAKVQCPSLNWSDVELLCPISGIQMIEPVNIPKCDSVYDRRSVVLKKEGKQAIEGHDLENLQEDQMKPVVKIERLLMFHTFTSVSDVPTWNKNPVRKKTINHALMPADLNWEGVEKCKSQLKVELPSNLGRANIDVVLTYYKEGLMAVYMKPSKQVDKSCQIYNPLYNPDKHEMAEVVLTLEAMKAFDKNVKTKKLSDYVNPKARISGASNIGPNEISEQQLPKMNFQPKEAIVVLLDTSTSMNSAIYPEKEDYTRIRAAKDLFTAFVDRTSAYQFHHVIGLTQFASQVKVEVEVTDEYIAFCDKLERLSGFGNTALYDAVASAISQLTEFADKFPECRKRILCLTDGEDNRSSSKPRQLVQTLKDCNIVMDTVLITGSGGNVNQKAITQATGGYCFFPSTMAEATKVFEFETLLSIRERNESVTSGELDVHRSIENYPYNSCDPYGKEDVSSNFSKKLDKGRFIPPQRVVQRSLLLGLESVSGAVTSSRAKRIMREIRQYNSDPHEYIDIYPSEESVTVWKVVISGPESTPYAGGVFLLYVKFPEQYPDKPPEIRFDTPIYHCNINTCGRICHSSLDNRYVPTMTMKVILSYIFGLLMDPEPSDPLDSVLALELRENRAQYESRARQVTEKFAMKQSRDQLKKQIVQEAEDANASDLFVCPLTQKVFEDPVDTQYGHTYERGALMKYLDEHNNLDPIAKKPVNRAQIRPNATVKKLVSTFRSTSRALM